jgi:adhesin/invasin
VQVSATATAFITDSASVMVPASGNALQNFALSQTLAGGQLRIVLTWGNRPRDLDAELYLPPGGRDNVVSAYTGTRAGVTLDRDDRDGSGPETITISQPSGGPYTFMVHHYSVGPDDGTLAASGAVVTVLRGDAVLQRFTVPSGAPGARWWTVFTLDGTAGTITPVNTMSSQNPIPR